MLRSVDSCMDDNSKTNHRKDYFILAHAHGVLMHQWVESIGVVSKKICCNHTGGGSRTSSWWGHIPNNRTRSAREFLAMPTFVKTMPTSLPRMRQTARDVNGIRLFHHTNRFLAIFCIRSRFIS